MNYFELFEIPVQLVVDRVALQKKFIELSRKYHPDYFVKEDGSKQAEALELSSTLNRAWKTFQSPDETIKYVLLQKGLLEEEEKYDLPPDFLVEIMDLNEQLMDADEEGQVKELESTIDNLQTRIYAPVKEVVEHYKDGIHTEKELLQVKAYYYKKKYLDRIRRQLAGNR